MGKIKGLKELAEIIGQEKKEGKKVVLANGIFDLLHVGHIRYLKEAKSLGDILIVAVNDDQSARLIKGEGRPLVPADERIEILSSISYIDYLVKFPQRTVEEVISTLKPDIQAKGTDYTVETVPEREIVESYGGKIAITGDPKLHSTSAILEKMKIKEH
ncbi:MAG: adenylyltransferase/cytidyltransferase family protein [Deltaproteobacteria bacterium]|nr:MAG: adenylyltransferase/cytidyltransferase family protein [Deltaproteobacteria bacterium]